MTARERTKAGSLTSVTLGAGLALTASTAACASGHSAPTAPVSVTSTTASAPATPPHITVQRTGGFAGRDDTVDVTPAGAWTATDKGGTKNTGELTAAQATHIHTLAADPRIAAEAAQKRPPTNCRDAFNYVLTVGTVRGSFADCPSDPNQPAASLALVKELLQSTIQPVR